MRILVTSDWHLDWTTGGYPRYSDLTEAVKRVVEAAVKQKVDGFMFLGDLSNPGNPRAWRAISFAVVVDQELGRLGIPTLWLTGNHDVVEDGHNSSVLLPLRAAGAWVVSEPCAGRFGGPRGAVDMIALPFTPRSHAYSPADFVGKVEPQGGPVLIVGHLHVEGIEPGSESVELARGREVFLPVEAIATRFKNAVVLNGHYHRRQVFECKGGARGLQVHVPGSLGRLTRGERDNSPGYLVVEV